MTEADNMITGMVYKICSNQTNKIYIGSTTKSLQKRLSGHRNHYTCYLNGTYHYVTSFDILQYEDNEIILLEIVHCNNVNELRTRERYHIELNECVNKTIPTQEKSVYRKKYSIKNKNKLDDYGTKYRIANKNKIDTYQANYRQNNKDRINKSQARYQQNNKDLTNKKNLCACGGKYTNAHKSTHNKSKKHINFCNITL